METKNIDYTACNDIGTIIYVAINNKFAGYIVISDKIKSDAKETIKNLKKNNIKKTVMLTGDKESTSKAIADKLEIDEVYAELLPDGKVEKLENLMKEKKAKGNTKGNIVFVGDGINDSPVLALSDIGISMGAARSR